MDEEMQNKTRVEAIYDQDSKRYHRFQIQGKDMVGQIYIRIGVRVPEVVVVTLKGHDLEAR